MRWTASATGHWWSKGQKMLKSRKPENTRNFGQVWPVILTAALVLFLAACGQKADEEKEMTSEVAISDAGQTDNIYYYTEENQAAFDLLQSEMEEAGCGFAAACLGRTTELKAVLGEADPDLAKADELLALYLENSGLREKYCFLSSIHSYRVRNIGDGEYLYVVIPDSGAEGMNLFERRENAEAGVERGSCTARIRGAYPLLILTDSAWIEEENGKGCILKIAGDTIEGDEVFILNAYSREITSEELTGNWRAAGVADDAGGARDLYLSVKDGRNAEFWYTYPGGEEQLMHFLGTVEEQGDCRFVFHMMSDSGLFMLDGVPEMPMEAIYRMSFGDEAGTRLLVTRISGDPFFTGIIDTEILFLPYENAEEIPVEAEAR